MLRPMAMIAGAMLISNAAQAQKYEYFNAPVTVKHFKENAEGMISEGFNVRDKHDRYTIVCKSRTSDAGIPVTPSFMRWSDSYDEEITKKPRQILSDPRGHSETTLMWAELCQRIVK